jgi:glycosyltransferase involved in cell wall biosynthesis
LVTKQLILSPQTQIKVLFIDHEVQLGGAEISMVNIVRYSSKKEVNYSVALPGNGPLSKMLIEAGVSQILYGRLDGWRWWEKGLKNRVKLMLSIPIQLKNIWAWRLLIKKSNPDIIHFNLTRMVEPIIAARMLGKLTVLHCREHQSNNKNFFGGIHAHVKLMSLCSFWVYNSQNTASSLEPFRPKSVNHKVIPNGIPVNEFMAAQSSNELGNSRKDKYIVLMAATLVPWKNHHDAFIVAKLVYNEIPNVEFVFAGTGSREYTQYLKNETKKLGLEKVVNFPGFVQNIIRLFQIADIVMHTSQNESFGKIYVEAMAASKPIVALRGGAAEELIKDKVTGFLFDGTELEKMAAQIIELLKDEQLSKKIGEKGRVYATQKYSMEIHCEQLLNVYSQLMKESTNG